MRIRTPDGGEVPFGQVAAVEPGRGYASIKRVNRNRAVNVTAAVDANVTSGGSVIEDLELAHALGATDLMHKPAKPQELLETIERLIAAN